MRGGECATISNPMQCNAKSATIGVRTTFKLGGSVHSTPFFQHGGGTT